MRRNRFEQIGRGLNDFATAEPSAEKATLKGLGWLILFFVGQVLFGAIAFVVTAGMAQAAVLEWRYGSSMPFIVAALPTILVVGLLEYWCAKITGHGPIKVIVLGALAVLFSA